MMRGFCEGGTATLRKPLGRVGVSLASPGSAHTLERPFQRAKNQVKRTIIGPVRPGGRSPSPSLEGGDLRARHGNAAPRACAHWRTRGKVRRHCCWSTRRLPLGARYDGVACGADDPHLQGPTTRSMTGRRLVRRDTASLRPQARTPRRPHAPGEPRASWRTSFLPLARRDASWSAHLQGVAFGLSAVLCAVVEGLPCTGPQCARPSSVHSGPSAVALTVMPRGWNALTP